MKSHCDWHVLYQDSISSRKSVRLCCLRVHDLAWWYIYTHDIFLKYGIYARAHTLTQRWVCPSPFFSIFTKTITTFSPRQSQHGSTRSVKVNVLQKDEREKHNGNTSRITERERQTDQFVPLHPFSKPDVPSRPFHLSIHRVNAALYWEGKWTCGNRRTQRETNNEGGKTRAWDLWWKSSVEIEARHRTRQWRWCFITQTRANRPNNTQRLGASVLPAFWVYADTHWPQLHCADNIQSSSASSWLRMSPKG